MKKYVLHLIGTPLFILAMSGPAAAAGYYLGILGGVGYLPDANVSDAEGRMIFSYDTGFDGSITAGYDLGDEYPKIGHGRVELEFNRAANDIDEVDFVEGKVGADGSVKRTAIMLNTIGEQAVRSGFTFYALLGLGWARVDFDNVSILDEPFADGSSNELAYQAGLGVSWKPSSHIVVEVSYRYYGTTDPKISGADGKDIDFEYSCNRFLAGLRVNF